MAGKPFGANEVWTVGVSPCGATCKYQCCLCLIKTKAAITDWECQKGFLRTERGNCVSLRNSECARDRLRTRECPPGGAPYRKSWTKPDKVTPTPRYIIPVPQTRQDF